MSLLARKSTPGPRSSKSVWEDNVALKVHTILDENKVDWTSVDVIRICYIDEPTGDIILWIGVKPKSLSYDAGANVVRQCKQLLVNEGIKDIEVEIREAVIVQSAQFLKTVDKVDPTVEVREPFTATLGIPICAQRMPSVEGTGGFFLTDGEKLFLVTARHVVYPRSNNQLHERTSMSQARHDVLVLSNTSFQQHLDSIQEEVEEQEATIQDERRRLDFLEDREEHEAIKVQEDVLLVSEKAKAKIEGLNDFYKELLVHWKTEHSRILGHVIFSPPIAVCAGIGKNYTQDIAVIEVDSSKIKLSNFRGNVIDLGTKFSAYKLTKMMNQNFDFPGDRLLKLRGTISDDELRHPQMVNQDGEHCIMVLKRGRTTGLTVGRANNIVSYTRKCFSDSYLKVSMEWPILAFDKDSGPFSAEGDSGSVVVDGAGRIGGLLTGGSGATDSTDLTYVTPIDFVLETNHRHKPLANVHLPQIGPEVRG